MTTSALMWKELQIHCSICGRHVILELSNTDEDGRAVHEHCYVRKVAIASTRPINEMRRSRSWVTLLLGWAQIGLPVPSQD